MKTPTNVVWELGRIRLPARIPIVETGKMLEFYSSKQSSWGMLRKYTERVMIGSASVFSNDANFFYGISSCIEEGYSIGELQKRKLVRIMTDVNSDGLVFETFEKKVESLLPESGSSRLAKELANNSKENAYRGIGTLSDKLEVKFFTPPSKSSQPSSYFSFEDLQ